MAGTRPLPAFAGRDDDARPDGRDVGLHADRGRDQRRDPDAGLLAVPVGAAGLSIERISYLASGRVVEFTRSLYRGDAYDFVAELTLGE